MQEESTEQGESGGEFDTSNLDLTGCPLKTELHCDDTLCSTLLFDRPNIWTQEELQYIPITLNQARYSIIYQVAVLNIIAAGISGNLSITITERNLMAQHLNQFIVYAMLVINDKLLLLVHPYQIHCSCVHQSSFKDVYLWFIKRCRSII